ncbi:hypothetical protein A9199_15585 [Donghicola sp. JL3646]|nr:hypothetical protein BSK21_03320 [Marivivens sp. JLT3646]APO86160.1 hypothetical protein BSK21_03340 [Marivivens sp. JLT3646]OBR36389.1 hypothetical protein A9199_15585 [Donghicola sp. JL3646]
MSTIDLVASTVASLVRLKTTQADLRQLRLLDAYYSHLITKTLIGSHDIQRDPRLAFGILGFQKWAKGRL